MSPILSHVLSSNAQIDHELTYSHSMSLHALATNLESLVPLTPTEALNFYLPLCQHLIKRIQVIDSSRNPLEHVILQKIVDTTETALVLYRTHLRPALIERLHYKIQGTKVPGASAFEPLKVLNQLFKDASQLASHYRDGESQIRLLALEALYDKERPVQEPFSFDSSFDLPFDLGSLHPSLSEPALEPGPVLLPTAVSVHTVFGPMTPQPLEQEPAEYPFHTVKPLHKSKVSQPKDTFAKKSLKRPADATSPPPATNPATARYSFRDRSKILRVEIPVESPGPLPKPKKRVYKPKKKHTAPKTRHAPAPPQVAGPPELPPSMAPSTSDTTLASSVFDFSDDELTPLPTSLSPIKSISSSPKRPRSPISILSPMKAYEHPHKRMKLEDGSPNRSFAKKLKIRGKFNVEKENDIEF